MSSPTSGAENRRAVVQSVDRALDVLLLLQRAPAPVGVADIARTIGLERTVVYRLLRTLRQREMVTESDGAFTLGPATMLLGQRYLENLPLRRVALPFMVDIREKVLRDHPWTLALAVPVGGLSTVIERMWTAATPLGLVLEVGDTLPLYRSAAGRSMLAYGHESTLDPAGEEYPDLGPVLDEIRKNGGIALVDGTTTSGLQAVACAITSADGVAIAAIGVGGLDLSAELSAKSPLATHLRHAADAIGRLAH